MPQVPEGFIKKILAKDDESGLYLELQEIPAGSVFPEHRHTSFEWVYILKGQLEDEFGEYPEGTFKINVPSSTHTPRSKNGCTLIAVRKGDYAPTQENLD